MYRNKIIAVTNRHLAAGDPLGIIRKIADFGPRALILREKDLPETEYADMARQTKDICDAAGVQLFMHSNIETAMQIGCRAVHLSIPSLQAYLETDGRDLPQCFEGVSISCHSIDEIREAVDAGATQIVLGNIFETDCKKGKPGRGLDFLRDAVEAAGSVPVFGIGGITPDNLDAVLQTGAAGGCMMSWWYR